MCIHNQPDHGHFCEGMYIYNFNCLVYQQLLNQLAIFFLSPVSQQMCVEILRAQEFGAREPYHSEGFGSEATEQTGLDELRQASHL